MKKKIERLYRDLASYLKLRDRQPIAEVRSKERPALFALIDRAFFAGRKAGRQEMRDAVIEAVKQPPPESIP